MDALALGMVHMVQEVQSGLIKQSQTMDIQEHIACLTAPNSVCSPRQVSSIFQRNAQSDMLQESFVLVRTEPEGCKDTSSPHFWPTNLPVILGPQTRHLVVRKSRKDGLQSE